MAQSVSAKAGSQGSFFGSDPAPLWRSADGPRPNETSSASKRQNPFDSERAIDMHAASNDVISDTQVVDEISWRLQRRERNTFSSNAASLIHPLNSLFAPNLSLFDEKIPCS